VSCFGLACYFLFCMPLRTEQLSFTTVPLQMAVSIGMREMGATLYRRVTLSGVTAVALLLLFVSQIDSQCYTLFFYCKVHCGRFRKFMVISRGSFILLARINRFYSLCNHFHQRFELAPPFEAASCLLRAPSSSGEALP